jgi:hypothetical protein
MGPFTCNAPVVATVLNEWLRRSPELFVELHVPRSAGEGFFYILNSYAHYDDLMTKAKPGSVFLILRDRQLPVRGVVDDNLISQALEGIADGEYYTITEPCAYPDSLSHLDVGNTHAELQTALEAFRGTEVWVGHEPEMPNAYWEKNVSDDVLIVVKQ